MCPPRPCPLGWHHLPVSLRPQLWLPREGGGGVPRLAWCPSSQGVLGKLAFPRLLTGPLRPGPLGRGGGRGEDPPPARLPAACLLPAPAWASRPSLGVSRPGRLTALVPPAAGRRPPSRGLAEAEEVQPGPCSPSRDGRAGEGEPTRSGPGPREALREPGWAAGPVGPALCVGRRGTCGCLLSPGCVRACRDAWRGGCRRSRRRMALQEAGFSDGPPSWSRSVRHLGRRGGPVHMAALGHHGCGERGCRGTRPRRGSDSR